MSPAPRVSIVMPTYNRKDTVRRAIDSVVQQRFADWELLIVDDGSTDGTKDLVAGIDPRVRVIVQENRGVAGARNRALSEVRGGLVAFLDSDDAWTQHHLALATAFFDAHPEADLYTSEFWESFGEHHAEVIHPRTEMKDWYPVTARRLGSSAFSLPPPHGDPYLWFYDTREVPGPAERAVLKQTPFEGAFHYRGELFQKWRWGWLMALQPTVITRRVLEAVGPIDGSYPVASDFGWLAQLCRRFPAHFFSAPGAIKFEYGDGKKGTLHEAHLVTGRTATQFHQDVLRFHEELFWKDHPEDPELSALRGFRQSLVARAALTQGQRGVALRALEQAAHSYPGVDTSALLWLARLPQDRVASLVYRGSQAGARLAGRVRRVVEHATHQSHRSAP